MEKEPLKCFKDNGIGNVTHPSHRLTGSERIPEVDYSVDNLYNTKLFTSLFMQRCISGK
jgi:hypothetical protein